MKIGARVLKTGLAISLSIFAALALIPGSDGMLAGIAAVYSTQPSVKKTFETFVSRIASNVIGGIFGVLMMHYLGSSFIAIGITSILTIAILNSLKWDEYIGLAVVTLIVIMLGNGAHDPVTQAIIRVADTIVGVIISFLVNWLIYPPKYDDRFFSTLDFATTEVLIWIRASLRKNAEYSVMHRDIKWAFKQMGKYNTYFDLIKHEMIFSKKEKINTQRKLVVYRHMAATSDAAITLLSALHNNDQIYRDFPVDLRVQIRERVETLLSAHEQILMKFNGKVPPEQVNFMKMNSEHREDYMRIFFEQARLQESNKLEHHFEGNGVIHIMSAIYLYEEELTNLNRLIRTFKMRNNPEAYCNNHIDHE
ncbi:FUSC family protein [Vaginisenegalia massiliensis]|uniref:FUSC family protein n=1 Tax=Vaginisenegalia massiliensis TaxID=2058294 RepID=UPI000F531632|nr:aromatic acid exporter family protein [Vaginisenegalia massiliensis]